MSIDPTIWANNYKFSNTENQPSVKPIYILCEVYHIFFKESGQSCTDAAKCDP